jgi:hypothetical protein
MPKFFNVQQNTDEWFSLRAGKITSSKLGCIMANLGKAFGEPAKKYAVNIAVEQLTGRVISSDGYQNEHMKRGHEQEPIARGLYEMEYFCDVANGGFFQSGDMGCSPDGLVGSDGMIEIKSVIPSVHYKNIKRGKCDPAYFWQCIGNMVVSGRDWLDFVSYCSEFPESSQLFVFRMSIDSYKNEVQAYKERTSEFLDYVSLIKREIS